MTSPNEPVAQTKSEAEMRRMANFAAILALVAVAVCVASAVTAIDVGSLTGNFSLILLVQRVVPVVPVIFYLFAALSARAILDRISEGQFFSARNISGLAELGSRVVWGAGVAIFLVPAILDWSNGVAGYRVDFRPEPLVIGTIGLCLTVLGRLLLRAQALEAELEAIV